MLADEKPVAWNQRCGFKAKPTVPLYTRPAPAATDTGLVTVLERPYLGSLVASSQAEELLAAKEAERAEQWRLRREMEADRDTQKAIAASLKADNAALTAQVV